MKRTPPKDRLLKFIDQRGPADCWPWTGSIGTWGYGSFWDGDKNINASRATYLYIVGPIPEGQVVCHSCDNPACCNPAHLFLGTQGDNIRDCNAKGRARGNFKGLFGAAHPRLVAKLTEDMVREARRLHYHEGVSQSEIARRWGVNSGTISRAVRGEKWAHVK